MLLIQQFNLQMLGWLSTYNATYEAHIDFVTTNLAWQNQTNVFSVNQNNSGNITLTDTVDFSITNNGSCGILIGATTTLEILLKLLKKVFGLCVE